MSTPLERQVLGDFGARLRDSGDVPQVLVQQLTDAVSDGKVPSPDALLRCIKTNVGDQPV
jgi:hypothetical protein